MLEMFHTLLTELPGTALAQRNPRSARLQHNSMASESNETRCTKLREVLQKISKLPLLIDIELDYASCWGDPTRSQSDIICAILRDYVSVFDLLFSKDLKWVSLNQVSGFQDVAINCANSLVWKPLQEEAECEDPDIHVICSTAQHLLRLLEDASHEVPLFAHSEANPLRIWEIFVAANVQRQCFCTLAFYEAFQWYECGQNFSESPLTTRLWDTIVLRFKAAEFHLKEHKMIDSNLWSQLEDFKQNLHNFWAKCLMWAKRPPNIYCCESCNGCQKSLWGFKALWCQGPSGAMRMVISLESSEDVPERALSPRPYVADLTALMSELTAAASKIANSLAAKPLEDAYKSQGSSPGSWVLTSNQADQETRRPGESASQVGDGSVISESYTLVSAVGGPHCFLPCHLFKALGQVESTFFISGKDRGKEHYVIAA